MQLRKKEMQEIQTKNEFHVFVIDAVLKENNYSKSYYAFVENSQSSISKEKVLLRIQIDSSKSSLEIGDKLLSKAQLKLIAAKRNPYDFDYRNYLLGQNICRQVYLEKGNWRKLNNFQFSFKRIAFGFRQKLIESLRKKIKNKDVLSVTVALLLGERQFISSKLQQNYANAGVIHILAVSGLHIGIIVLLLHFILQPLKIFKHGVIIKFVLMLLFLWCYAFLAGLSASVIRAVTMFSFVSFGLVIKHRSNVYHSIITSALILVLVNPFYFFDLGFKMSYIAVFSIVTLYSMLTKLWQPQNKIIKYLWNMTAVSISAQVGLLPLSLYYFHQFPGLFIVSNLVILPSLGVVLVLGFVLLFLIVFEVDCEICVQSYTVLVHTLNKFITYISNQESWLFDTIYFSGVLLVVSYVSLVLFVFVLKKIRLRRIYAWGVSLLLFQLVFFYELYKRQHKEELVIYHQYKKTVVSITSDSRVSFYGGVNSKKEHLVKNYLEKTGVSLDTIDSEVSSVFKFKEQYILVIGTEGIYKISNFNPEIILVKNSPKMNLDRCLEQLQPKIMIADGSNYPYLKERWKETCEKKKVSFYDTSVLGAFVLTSEKSSLDFLFPNFHINTPVVRNITSE
jgi:competence protein ComEC